MTARVGDVVHTMSCHLPLLYAPGAPAPVLRLPVQPLPLLAQFQTTQAAALQVVWPHSLLQLVQLRDRCTCPLQQLLSAAAARVHAAAAAAASHALTESPCRGAWQPV